MILNAEVRVRPDAQAIAADGGSLRKSIGRIRSGVARRARDHG
jgi:hypothetical protein